MEKVVKLKYQLLIIRLRRLFVDFFQKKYSTYLAGYMEADMEHCQGWRDRFTETMSSVPLHIDDPTKNEAEKLGMPVEESREKLYGLKRSGRRAEFLDIIDRIFSVDLKQVANCSFLVVYWRSDIKTVGTIGEMQLATLLGIPIYCITPDKISELNSWLLGMILINDGEIFRTPNECAKYIIQKYYAKKQSITVGAVLIKGDEQNGKQ